MNPYSHNLPVDAESESVSLFFSCKQLKDADVFSKSDPFLKVYSVDTHNRKQNSKPKPQKLIKTTEVVKNNLNPDFETSLKVEYFFERNQQFRVEVVDCDDAVKKQGDFLGEAEFALGDVVGSKYNTRVFDIRRKGKKAGRLIVRAEQENELPKFEVSFDVVFRNAPSSGLFSSKKRFFEIRKQRVSRDARRHLVRNDLDFAQADRQDWQLVHRSSPSAGDEHRFSVSRVSSARLCDSDFNLPLQVVLLKFKSSGAHYEVASRKTTLGELAAAHKNVQMVNSPKMQGKPTPTLGVSGFSKREVVSFTDFLRGGLNLVQFMGIDFTLSNRPCTEVGSLHHFAPGSLNQYQRAILALGEILEKYNSSGVIPCYGFGAVLPNNQKSFDFPINLNFDAPYLNTYAQVFQCYQSVLGQIRFSGPTNFSPLLRAIIAYTESNLAVSPYNYTVFTILTDGAISDMEDTVAEIVRASRLPLSIIIVGRLWVMGFGYVV